MKITHSLSCLALVASLAPVSFGAPPAKKAPAKATEAAAPAPGASYDSADAALAALVEAAKTGDRANLRKVLGPAMDGLAPTDQVQSQNEMKAFVAAAAEGTKIELKDKKALAIIGKDGWTFPAPIVQGADGKWTWDTAAGVEEFLNRRIGENELSAISGLVSLVEAQREYFTVEWNNDGVNQFASKFISSDDNRDGLYWPTENGEPISPLTSLIAEAQEQGYTKSADGKPTPYQGYFFKLLKKQGPAARGGAYSYVLNNRLIAGFAYVAYPADYGKSGVMTFIVNQHGVVYQRDLGPNTGKLAAAMTDYNPGTGWKVATEATGFEEATATTTETKEATAPKATPAKGKK